MHTKSKGLKVGDDVDAAAKDLASLRKGGKLTFKVAGRAKTGSTTEVVPEPKRGQVVGLDSSRIRTLREQYRDALEEEKRAAAKRKNAKQEREAAEESLVRARENASLGDSRAEVQLAARVTDMLIKERASEDRLKSAKKDLKAATIAYRNHIDEDL